MAVSAAVVLVGLLTPPAVAQAGPDDPYRPQQYGLDQIHVSAAWRHATGEGIVIAVIDSGVDLQHPDLVDRLYRDGRGRVIGRDFVDGDADAQDRNGHGTMIAGIAAAATDNGEGGAGVAPDARIMPIRVLDEDGSGSSQDVESGIRWAVDHGADIVNLSLESVETLTDVVIPRAPAGAVDYAWERGVIVVAASGNSGSAFTDYPTTAPVLLVGATDREGRRAEFSNTGRRDAVMAPGVGIISSWWCAPDDDRCDGDEHTYGEADGTSFAAPFVSGLAALLREQGLGHDQAVRRIRETAVDMGPEGPDDETGYGRIDAGAATASPSVVPRAPASSPPQQPSDTQPAGDGSVAGQPTPASPRRGRPGSPSGQGDGAPSPEATAPPPAPVVASPSFTPPIAAAPSQVPAPGGSRWVPVIAVLVVIAVAGTLIVLSRES